VGVCVCVCMCVVVRMPAWTYVCMCTCQAVSADFRTLGRTAFQRVYEVEMFRQWKETSMGKQSAANLAAMFAANVQQSPGTEPLSDAFIDNALTVYNRALNIPVVKDAVLQMDTDHGHASPFNSVYKMHAIVRRAGDSAKITWCFLSIVDCIKAKLLGPADVTVRSLAGNATSKGLVDLLLFKLTMKDYLFEMMDKLDLPVLVKTALREHLADHAQYRGTVKELPGCSLPDLSWKAGWPQSGDSMLQFIEAPCLLNACNFPDPLKPS
jgi:hypothetical protein